MSFKFRLGKGTEAKRFKLSGTLSLNEGFCPPGSERSYITVCSCGATCDCGCGDVKNAIEGAVEKLGIPVTVGSMKTACSGKCHQGPFVGFPHKNIFYSGVTGEWAEKIIYETLVGGRILFELLYLTPNRSYRADVIFNKNEKYLVTIDDSLCMVKLADYFLKFEDGVSCGKCVPCRQGNMRLRKVIGKIIEGKGEEGDVEELKSICDAMRLAAYCEFAETTSMPLLLSLEHFEQEFIDHVEKKECAAGECPALSKQSKVGGQEAVAA